MTANASSRHLFDLNGRVAVVTGGLGQLGRQFTGALLDHGARVAILDTADNGEQPDGWGDGVDVVAADVTDRASLAAALESISGMWEVPRVLVNAAALDSPPNAPHGENGPFECYPSESFDRVMEVNVKGVALCCQVFGGAMAEAARGSVINISSIYGLVSPDQRIYEYRRQGGEDFYKPVAYSASKSALMNLTRYLATYWAPRNVRVNTLTLGGVFNHQDDEFLRGYCDHVPLGRMADASDYNGAVVFLASDASSYMTGSNLIMDGGWTAW
jgi:NAD(P)-dependent dehydrogenase (short-subunit alcohol dehydrogenase family)